MSSPPSSPDARICTKLPRRLRIRGGGGRRPSLGTHPRSLPQPRPHRPSLCGFEMQMNGALGSPPAPPSPRRQGRGGHGRADAERSGGILTPEEGNARSRPSLRVQGEPQVNRLRCAVCKTRAVCRCPLLPPSGRRPGLEPDEPHPCSQRTQARPPVCSHHRWRLRGAQGGERAAQGLQPHLRPPVLYREALNKGSSEPGARRAGKPTRCPGKRQLAVTCNQTAHLCDSKSTPCPAEGNNAHPASPIPHLTTGTSGRFKAWAPGPSHQKLLQKGFTSHRFRGSGHTWGPDHLPLLYFQCNCILSSEGRLTIELK